MRDRLWSTGLSVTFWYAFAAVCYFTLICLASSTTDDCALLNSFLRRSGSPMRNCCSGHEPRVNCSDGKYISQLRLSGLNLSGIIPNGTIGALQNLTLLDLSRNNLSGDVPADIWNSSSLQYLNLSANKFNGSIFSALPSLANLTSVNDSANGVQSRNYTDEQSSLGHYSLQSLDLSANLISGTLGENLCTVFGNLTVLNISFNRIQLGNFSQCSNLQSLNASFNLLRGALLPEIFEATSLRILDLARNGLSGAIPTTVWQLKQLVFLDLSSNILTGRFVVKETLPSLKNLNISHNQLTLDVNRTAFIKFGESAFTNNRKIVCTDCALVPTLAPSPPPALPPGFSPFQVVRKRSLVVGTAAIAGIVVGGVVGIVFLVVVSVILRKRRRRTKWVSKPPPFRFPPDRQIPEIGPFSFEADSGTWVADVKDPTAVNVIIFEKPLLNLTFADLLQATSSFNREAEVGDGSGLVYKCELPGVLSGDERVAIKVVEDGQNWRREEALRSLETMGKMQHENLVPLLGYCIVGEEKLLLYKYMEGGSLEDVLHALPGGVLDIDENCGMDWEGQGERREGNREGVSWARRVEIAVGAARALAFLHHGWAEQVVHGGVSAASVMFEDGSGIAKLANYAGEALRTRGVEAEYMAPECRGGAASGAAAAAATGGRWTSRADVYSFGVVLLELATGRRAAAGGGSGQSYASLAAWVRQLTKEKRVERAVDPKLKAGGVIEGQVVEMLKVGYLCTSESAAKRPSMQQVLGLLKDLAASAAASSSSSASASTPP